MLLSSAYLGRRDTTKAIGVLGKFVAVAPKDPRGPYLLGIALRVKGKLKEAKREFEAALALAPGYVDPLNQLVAMALAEKQPDAALETEDAGSTKEQARRTGGNVGPPLDPRGAKGK